MDAIVTLDNFKLMVRALIKFLNQLSERDKAAAIKFLIATLKNSTKEQFKYWSDEDRSVWFDSTRIFDRKTSTTKATTTTTTALTAVRGNFELHTTLVADNFGGDNDNDDACILKWPTDTGLTISLENIKNEGNFNTALVPFHQEQKPYQQQRAQLRSRFRVGTPFGRDIKTLFDDLGYNSERDLLKVFLNRFIFDQADNDRSLVRVHQHIDHLKPEATLTEIMDTDDIDENTQKSSEESLPETGNKNDADVSQNKAPRKRKLYKCYQCPKYYLKRKTLAVHYKFHPGFCYDCGQPNGSTVEERVQHNQLNHSKQYPYVCDKCGDSMSRNQQYLSHMKTHDKEPVFRSECLRCGEKFTNAKAYKDHLHEMGHMEGARVCEYCGKSFGDAAMLQQHIKRVHQTSKAHPCEHCNKSFDNRSNLLRHMHLHKNQGTNFVCSQCNASYTTMNALKDHINDKHTKKKVHTCEICNKEFTNGHLYRNHVVTHSEDRPFACTICSKAFKLKTNLVRHTKRCHAAEDKKDGSGSTSGIKRSLSEKDESSAEMSLTPPLKKPFQPFSSESSFFKNNISSVHFQSSSSTQSPSSISNEADVLSKEPNQVIETKMQPFQHQPPIAVPSMQDTFPTARDAPFASGPVAFPPSVPNIPPTQLPPNTNQGYMPYVEPFQQQHIVKASPKSHQKARTPVHNQRTPPQPQQPPQHMHGIPPSATHGHGLPAAAPNRHPMSASLQRHGMHNQMMPSGMHPQQQYMNVPASSPQNQQQAMIIAANQQNQQQSERFVVRDDKAPILPSETEKTNRYRARQAASSRFPQISEYHRPSGAVTPKGGQNPSALQSHQQSWGNFPNLIDEQQHAAAQHQNQQHAAAQHQNQQQHAAAQHQNQQHAAAQHQNQPNIQTQHFPPQQYQSYQPQPQPQSQPHHSNQVYPSRAPSQSKSRAKYDYNYQQQQVSPYAYASNPAATSAYNVEANAWNQMTPTLVETSSGQYMSIDQIEMSKYNRTMPAPDAKMTSFPYQNMWPTEQSKIDFETNNLEAVSKQEQMATQQSANQTTSATGAAANTYNNIGNILTNLELLGNNSNFDPGNYEVMSSNYAQMPAANGDNSSYYNIQSTHGQQQQQQQHVYNNRVQHTPESQQPNNMPAMHPQDNNSWMQQSANHQGQQQHAMSTDNRTMDDYKSNDFMELNNASGNVLLPSLADYLYHPLGGTGADVSVPNNNNI